MRKKLKFPPPSLTDWVWMPQRCTAEHPAPKGVQYGWMHPSSQYIDPHPTDTNLARFICPHCGRDEYTYPTFQPKGKRWRPGEREFY